MSIFNEEQIKAMFSREYIIQGIFRQPVWRVYGRIISNRHYKTNNVDIKNETNPTSAMGNLL